MTSSFLALEKMISFNCKKLVFESVSKLWLPLEMFEPSA